MDFLADAHYRVTNDSGSLELVGETDAVRARFRLRPETDGLWHDLREGFRNIMIGEAAVPSAAFDLEDAEGDCRFMLTRHAGTRLHFEVHVSDPHGAPFGTAATTGDALGPRPEVELRDASGTIVGAMHAGGDIAAWDDRGSLATATPVRGDGMLPRPTWDLRLTAAASPTARVLIVAGLAGLLLQT